MKRKCQVCGKENGSCNQYITKTGQGITIFPSCLVWGMDATSKLARQAHKDGLLVKPPKPKGEKKKRLL